MAEGMVRTNDQGLRERLRAFLASRGCDLVGGEDPQHLALVITDPAAFEDLAAAIVQHLSPAAAAPAPQTHPQKDPQAPDDPLVGETAQMRTLKAYLATVATTDSNVLITGETGTGKELVAQQLHRASRRRNKPFVCINCAAIPESLIESELFGYDRGAFTGATSARAGKLQQANGGTVFFDEIGEMSRFAQAKILRAIEAKEIYPLGAQRSVQLNVRVIAATNRDLEAMIRDDSFRSDLYFRLKVVRLTLPPLRDRLSDIPLLVRHWLPALNATFGRQVTTVTADVLRSLMTHSWPGNVRELKNVLEISFLHLPPHATTLASLPEPLDLLSTGVTDGGGDEREQLLSALVATRWNISETARRLHWSRMTIYRRLAKYELPVTRPVTPKAGVVTASDSQ